jgi:rubredoxin
VTLNGGCTDARQHFTALHWLGVAVRPSVLYPALMPAFICNACGTQYSPAEAPPPACLICTDERQFVPADAEGAALGTAIRLPRRSK